MPGVGERVFVDTNILVYAHDASAGVKQEKAREVVLELWETGLGCVSVQVLQELYNAVTRKVPKPLARTEAQAILRDLAAWTVHAPTAEDVIQAIDIEERYSMSFWDAMIVRSAIQTRCTTILSEDLAAGQEYSGVLIVNPLA
ncbi:MAG: PIN domain-containing protein [Bacillota bacterium]